MGLLRFPMPYVETTNEIQAYRRKNMRNKNDNAPKVSGNSSGERRIDPLSARVLAHYVRQVELAGFIRAGAKALFGKVVAWHRRKTLSFELNGKPDYLLKDIGFTRSEISAVVNGELGRKTLSLSPAGCQSAPAFYGNDADKDDNPDEIPPLAA